MSPILPQHGDFIARNVFSLMLCKKGQKHLIGWLLTGENKLTLIYLPINVTDS
jgi:hypothetical protein